MERDVQLHASNEVLYFKDASGVSVCLVKHTVDYGVEVVDGVDEIDGIEYLVGGRRIWRGLVTFR